MAHVLLTHTHPHTHHSGNHTLTLQIWKDEEVVGHVPKALSKITSFFLKYDGNVVFCEVTGRRVNHGVGLRMEVPCVYKFYGRQAHIKKLQEIVSKQ